MGEISPAMTTKLRDITHNWQFKYSLKYYDSIYLVYTTANLAQRKKHLASKRVLVKQKHDVVKNVKIISVLLVISQPHKSFDK